MAGLFGFGTRVISETISFGLRRERQQTVIFPRNRAAIAFSSEMDAGSREENASKQGI
jgi:hypothetical protein